MKVIHREGAGGDNRAAVYEREGHMSAGGWISYERGVVVGTVRVINGTMSYAFGVLKHRGKVDRVHWLPCNPGMLREVPVREGVTV
jgi:hypothetical protein